MNTTVKRYHNRRQQQGYVLVIVLSILLMLSILGIGAMLVGTGEVESAGVEVQRNVAKHCAEFAMARLVSEFRSSSSMLSDYVTISFDQPAHLELPVDDSGDTSSYTYWVGHYGQKDTPQNIVSSITAAQASALQNVPNVGQNMTNQLSYNGGGANSVVKYYNLVVTCRAPSGVEVEMQSLLKRGL